MNIILNTAAAIFYLLIPATLLASGWNVLAPAAWCWLERGTAAIAGAIATGLLFLFVWSYMEAEKKSSQNTPKTRPASQTATGSSNGAASGTQQALSTGSRTCCATPLPATLRNATAIGNALQLLMGHSNQQLLRTRYVKLRGLSGAKAQAFWCSGGASYGCSEDSKACSRMSCPWYQEAG